MSIKQKPEERLREYLSRFNSNALEVKNLDQSVALAAISNGEVPSPVKPRTARVEGGFL